MAGCLIMVSKERKEKRKIGIVNLCVVLDFPKTVAYENSKLKGFQESKWTQILNKIHCLFKIESLLFILFVLPNALLYRSSNCDETLMNCCCAYAWDGLRGGIGVTGRRLQGQGQQIINECTIFKARIVYFKQR